MPFTTGQPNMGRPGMKDKPYPARALSREDVDRILKGMSRTAPTGLRNRLTVMLMHRCGLRIGETLGITVGELDAERGEVRVMGKGHKSRLVGVPDDVLTAYAAWMRVRPRAGGPLICTLQGNPVSGQYVRAMLARTARKAGVSGRVNPHSLRHTFAMELLREGVELPKLQQALGHSSLASTGEYLKHISQSEVITTMQHRG